MKNINSLCLSLLIALLLLFLCTGCDLMPSWNSIYVVNRSSTEQVALLAVAVDGVKLDYQDTKLPKQRYLKKPGEFKSRPQLHHIDLWVKKENAPVEKYSCTVQSVSGGASQYLIIMIRVLNVAYVLKKALVISFRIK